MSITVVLPAYKEEENLRVLLPQMQTALADLPCESHVLVVDTMSPTDKTAEVCAENAVQYVNRVGGNNYGDAIRTGIQQSDSEWIVIMDADGSHNPRDIAKLYQKATEHHDIVIGSRYIHGGNSHNGLVLKAMSFIVNFTYRIVFHIKAKDVSNSFRIYRTERLKPLPLISENFDIVEEMLILFSVSYPDFSLAEIPIYFNKRMHGESKRDLLRFALSYISSMFRLLKIKFTHKRVNHTSTTSH